MANLGNTIINGALRVNGKINSSDVISAPSFVGALTGNADTATKLKTARTINGTSFDGSGNITTANWGTARNIGIVNSDGTGTAVTVSVNGSGNVNLKLPATIKASLTGNADTATKLQTARTINGTSFDGSSNITTTNWGTARNITIQDSTAANSGTAVSVNGSGNVNLKLPATIAASLSGNASSASKAAQLTTARKINGVSFDGTANININKLVCIDVSGQTIDWNTYCYTNGYTEGIWNSASDGGASSFTNLAVSGKSCRIELKLIRFISTSDYIQLQEQLVGVTKTLYRRYCVNGTWTNWVMVSVNGVAANATKLATARTIGVSGVTGTAQSFNGTANIVIPITAVPSTLLTNKSAIKGSEITNDKHWVPSSDASVTNFVSMTAEEYATNANSLATGTIVAITDGVEGYVTTQATSLTCDLPLDL